jgi:glyoxylase-like metal-dependent hydrolase (beta-lactamase superfamily II)
MKATPAGTRLNVQYFPVGSGGFFRAPVLLTAATEALLIDGSSTYSDGRALAEAIKVTGRTLSTIYISQSDPDYYFGLKPVNEAFPQSKVVANVETLAAIKGNVEKKIAIWGPQL